MFDFTNHIVLNDVIYTTPENMANGVNATDLATGNASVKQPNFIVGKRNGKGPDFRIAGVPFKLSDIESVQYATAKDEKLATATLDFASIDTHMNKVNNTAVDTTFKIDIYVALSMHSQDPFYANPWNQKGKHISPIEFEVKTSDIATADKKEELTKRVYDSIKKYMQLINMGEKVLNVSISKPEGNNTKNTLLVFTAVNGFQIFKEAILQRYEDEVKRNPTCCGFQGDFVKVADLTVTKGQEAFLDYDWMIHNLRLPTLQNLNYWTLNKEMPAAGAKYNQYIIKMVTVRDGIAGGILGQRATSVTTHVFYVNKAVDELVGTGFNSKLTAVLSGGNITIATDADDELKDASKQDSQLQNTKVETKKYKPVINPSNNDNN